MNGYVPKPFSVSELMIAFPQALGKKSDTTSAKNETNKQDNLTLKDSSQRIQFDHLHKFVNGDPESLNHYLRLFIELIPARINILKEALETKDYIMVRKTVHAMKPQLKSLGMMSASKLAEKIESEYYREHDIPANAEALIQECSSAVQEVRKELG